ATRGTIQDAGGNPLLTTSFVGAPYTINKLHNVTSVVSVTLTQTGDPLHSRQVTLKNRTASPILGPLYIVLNNLPTGVTLLNRTGKTSTGQSYIKLNRGLNVGASLTQLLQFGNLN